MHYQELISDWKGAEYDGVKGTPPCWMPKHHLDYFGDVQRELCHGVVSGEYSYAEVIRKVRQYAFGSAICRFFARPSHETHLYFLGDLLRASEIAKSESVQAALTLLLGQPLSRDAARGAKIKTSAALGHAKTHGTPEEKASRRELYQQEVDSLHRKSPYLSRNRINEIAAKKFGVSSKTIYRNTT